jgi:hypothetical protein
MGLDKLFARQLGQDLAAPRRKIVVGHRRSSMRSVLNSEPAEQNEDEQDHKQEADASAWSPAVGMPAGSKGWPRTATGAGR